VVALGDLLLQKYAPAFSPTSLIFGLPNGGNPSVGAEHQESVFSGSCRRNICKNNTGDRISWEKRRRGRGGVQHPTALRSPWVFDTSYSTGRAFPAPTRRVWVLALRILRRKDGVGRALVRASRCEGKSGKESKRQRSVCHLILIWVILYSSLRNCKSLINEM